MTLTCKWLPAIAAACCIGCVPTITVEKVRGVCKKTGLSKQSFVVPLDTPVAVWRVVNKCDAAVQVEVRDFKYKGTARDPMICLGHPLKAYPNSKGWIACVVKYDMRENDPYDYTVYIDGNPVSDPQVVIKRDPGLEK